MFAKVELSSVQSASLKFWLLIIAYPRTPFNVERCSLVRNSRFSLEEMKKMANFIKFYQNLYEKYENLFCFYEIIYKIRRNRFLYKLIYNILERVHASAPVPHAMLAGALVFP